MSETSASRRLNCPKCGEMVLSEDKFCFHCGRRLTPQVAAATRKKPGWRWWPLGILGALLLMALGYWVHRQSLVIARLKGEVSRLDASVKSRRPLSNDLHPVVTTTTSYPGNMPSSANWSVEIKTYANVTFSIRVPNSMDQALTTPRGSWEWGDPNTPYQVGLAVTAAKPIRASVALGANTYGTVITRSGDAASQQLYVNWAPSHWVEVSMTVPTSHINWLEAIATSVRIS